MKRYRLVESDVAALDPDLKALYEAVEGLEASKPGSAEKFAKIVQTKYGITSTDNLKKFVLGCTKIPIGGVSIAGFALSISGAVTGGAELYSRIKSMGAAGLYDKLGFDISAAAVACIMLSFIFWKLFRFVISSSNKTESTNNKSYSEQKAILESEIFINRIGQFIESDAGNPAVKLNATAEKADGICRRMFNWIKGKVSEGWGWIKKHPYITIAFLIVIGCVFYYINVLRGQVANLQGAVGELQSTNAGLSEKVAELSKQLKQNIDMNEVRKYFFTTKQMVRDEISDAVKITLKDGRFDGRQFIRDNVAKAISSMDKNQFAAYFKHIYNFVLSGTGAPDNEYFKAYDTALSAIKEYIGVDAYRDLIKISSNNLVFQ